TARVGVNMSFWEPVRIAETVREPYCFPMLNGLQLDPGVRAPEPGTSERHERFGKSHPTTFRHLHWYMNPLIFVLEVMLDTGCLEQGLFDVAYMTELDPLWVDEEATFVLQPEAALFASLPAVAACAADAVAATAGFPINELFWCAGAQGGLYPLAGWVGHLVSPIDTSVLLMQRMTAKLHRQGQMWAGIGREAQCGPFMQPLMDKRQYKYQMVYPARATDKSITGSCCHPFGRPTMLWGANKSFPIRGEDFAYQIFRRRDCCAGAGLP
ncbi:MAG TPA: TraU family protein, partial [Burkholderiaceae bacterium]|nr:TraU family protein [Burkholderiaceae bacterium]